MATKPTNVTISSTTATSVQLTWTAGAGNHYDVYRAVSARQGFFAAPIKVNTAPVAIGATGYLDNAANSGANAPSPQQHYIYFVFAVDLGGAMDPANPAYATTWSGTDAVKAIRAAILVRMGGVLPATWKQMPYTADPNVNDWNRFDNTYGVVLGPDSVIPGNVGRYDKIQTYHLLLARKTNRKDQSDTELMSVTDDLASRMEQIAADLIKNKCGAPSLVVVSEPAEKQDPEHFQDKAVCFLKAQVKVQYKIAV